MRERPTTLVRFVDHQHGPLVFEGVPGPRSYYAEKRQFNPFERTDDETPTRVILPGEHYEGPYKVSVPRLKTEFRPYEAPKSGPSRHSLVPGSQDLCQSCEDIELKRLLESPQGIYYELGWYRSITECEGCSLCRLITHAFKAVRRSESLANPAGTTRASSDGPDYEHCFVILECRPIIAPLPPQRRDRPYELSVMLIDGETRTLSSTASIRPLASTVAKLRKSPMFHGRLVDPALADLARARSWIEECCEAHPCGSKRPQDGQANSPESPEPGPEEPPPNDGTTKEEGSPGGRQASAEERLLRVIDVKAACLVFVPQSDRYVALSYVWPRFDALRLSLSNREDLHRRGALEMRKGQLPRVIRDAMGLVAELGENYLWVDALCITQDDKEEKADLIGIMDQVYGRAFVTLVIATAASPDLDYAIPGYNGASRTVQQYTAKLEGIDLVTALPDSNEALEDSVWSTRGWTFQEGILSKRCLILTDKQMFFRCAQDSRSEDVVAEGSDPGLTNHPARPSLRVGQIEYLTNREFLKNAENDHVFREYSLLVSAYTKRHFTMHEDILHGFLGIMTTLVPSLPKPQGFFVGLPMHIFDQAILWYPTSPLERRELAAMGTLKTPVPSWSWAGWKGTVSYERSYAHDLRDRDTLRIMVEWWRTPDAATLVPLRNYADAVTPATAFSHGLLAARARALRHAQLVCWAACVRLRVAREEATVREWAADWRQVLPCFALLDRDGDACGMLPSADRAWAARHREKASATPGADGADGADGAGEYEFLLLSYTTESFVDGTTWRSRFFDPKFDILADNKQRFCFYNLMLVEYDAEGIAYRQGIGRVHVDAVNRQMDDIERKIVILG